MLNFRIPLLLLAINLAFIAARDAGTGGGTEGVTQDELVCGLNAYRKEKSLKPFSVSKIVENVGKELTKDKEGLQDSLVDDAMKLLGEKGYDVEKFGVVRLVGCDSGTACAKDIISKRKMYADGPFDTVGVGKSANAVFAFFVEGKGKDNTAPKCGAPEQTGVLSPDAGGQEVVMDVEAAVVKEEKKEQKEKQQEVKNAVKAVNSNAMNLSTEKLACLINKERRARKAKIVRYNSIVSDIATKEAIAKKTDNFFDVAAQSGIKFPISFSRLFATNCRTEQDCLKVWLTTALDSLIDRNADMIGVGYNADKTYLEVLLIEAEDTGLEKKEMPNNC